MMKKIDDNGMQDKNGETKENNKSQPSISEEIPVVTAETNEDNTQAIQTRRRALRVNDIIQYRLQNTDEWIKATVTGRAGKATGKNKNWYNIKEDVSEERKSINLDEVEWEQITENANVNLVLKQDNACSEDTAAKLAELEKLKHFNT